MVLDELTAAMEQLKVKHNTHFAQFLEKKTQTGPLRRKLALKLPLNRGEATGEGFHALMTENDKKSSDSPYTLRDKDLTETLTEIKRESLELFAKIEGLLAQKTAPFRFSPELKHDDISLKGEESRANNTTYSQGAALVEPRLPMNRSSRISFTIERIGEYGKAWIGVCYKSIVQQHSFIPRGNQ